MLCFTLPPEVFSPFPHGTASLSVTQEYLALRGGPRGFTRGSTCPMLLGLEHRAEGSRLLDYHHLGCIAQMLRLGTSGLQRPPTTPPVRAV